MTDTGNFDHRRYVSHAKRRYYVAWAGQDLLGDWCIFSSWGALDSARGGSMSRPLHSRDECSRAIEQLHAHRIARGYVLAGGRPPAS